MQPRDLERLVAVTDPAVSPDGTRVTVTVTTVDVERNRYNSAIWLVPADPAAGEARPLTGGEHADADAGARWSPDGTRIAFVRTARADDGVARSSVVVLPVDGPGEERVVAEGGDAVADVDWSPDGERLAWTERVTDPGGVPAGTPDRDRPPRRVDTLHSRLDDVGWTIDRRAQAFVGRVDATEHPRQVTSGPYDHATPRWSPDGRTLVVVAARHERWDVTAAVDLYLLDVDSAAGGGGRDAAPELRRLTDSTLAWARPSWSPDGSRIAGVVLDERDGWHNPRPLVVDVATGAVVDAAPGVDRCFEPTTGGRPPVWLDDETLLVSREDRGRVGLLRLAADGSAAPAEVAAPAAWVTGFDAVAGTLAVVAGDANTPGELFVDGERRTHACSAFLAACPPLPVERFAVPSPAGDGDVDAWFLAPDPAAVPAGGDGRWPLLVSVHGGPMSQYGERWFDEWQLWASAGFAVVACNPHGSSGLDDAWARAIRSPLADVDPGTGWGGVDADDVLAVLDAALERWPRVDPTRVGIHGGSYGGFMTSWLCARTDRFAAGCSERAVNNLLSEEWSSDIAGTFWRELGVSHLEHPEEYLRMSPATYVRDIACPMLLVHSESDLRCHIEQADALFVPLRLLGRDVEYWRFPGESHELSRSGAPVHRIRRAELIIDFFRRKLGVATGRSDP